MIAVRQQSRSSDESERRQKIYKEGRGTNRDDTSIIDNTTIFYFFIL